MSKKAFWTALAIALIVTVIVFSKLETLSKQVGPLSFDILLLKLQQKANDSIVIDPAEKGYGRLDTNSGFFFISCEDVQPYLDGYKLILNIGNPLYVKYDGFKLSIKYGRQFDFKTMNYGNWEGSLKITEKAFTDELLPATWNKIEMVLAPAKPEEMRYIRISMKTDKVMLNQP